MPVLSLLGAGWVTSVTFHASQLPNYYEELCQLSKGITEKKILKSLMDHTQPKKTIQDVAQPYRTKEDNTVIQQYNPSNDLTMLYNTIQFNERLNRTA